MRVIVNTLSAGSSASLCDHARVRYVPVYYDVSVVLTGGRGELLWTDVDLSDSIVCL